MADSKIKNGQQDLSDIFSLKGKAKALFTTHYITLLTQDSCVLKASLTMHRTKSSMYPTSVGTQVPVRKTGLYSGITFQFKKTKCMDLF